MRGHPVFIAQHATATCYHGCIEKWHKFPQHRELTQSEQEYLVSIIMEWINRQINLNNTSNRIRQKNNAKTLVSLVFDII